MLGIRTLEDVTPANLANLCLRPLSQAFLRKKSNKKKDKINKEKQGENNNKKRKGIMENRHNRP